jgi:heme/copper-type cytochrome/quinol oxidase subunit 4
MFKLPGLMFPLFIFLFFVLTPFPAHADVSGDGGQSVARHYQRGLTYNGKEVNTSTIPAFVIGILLTISLEALVFFLAGYRSFMAQQKLVIVNIISNSAINGAVFLLNSYNKAHPHYYWQGGGLIEIFTPVIIVLLEILVIIAEYLFLRKYLTGKHLLSVVFCANLFSALIGTFLLISIIGHFF